MNRMHAIQHELLTREAARCDARFGIERRTFLRGAMGALAMTAIAQQLPRSRSRAEALDSFSPPSDACYAALASFTRDDQCSALDWAMLLAAADAQQPAMADTVMNMLRSLTNMYNGFAVSELQHVLQTATRARRDNASDELVLSALLHDSGDALTTANHAELTAALIRPYVSDASYRIVRSHMEFQLKHYGDKLLLPTDLRDRYIAEPWYADAVRFSDEWDQTSFDPDYSTLPLEEFEPLVRETFSRVPEHVARLARDCL